MAAEIKRDKESRTQRTEFVWQKEDLNKMLALPQHVNSDRQSAWSHIKNYTQFYDQINEFKEDVEKLAEEINSEIDKHIKDTTDENMQAHKTLQLCKQLVQVALKEFIDIYEDKLDKPNDDRWYLKRSWCDTGPEYDMFTQGVANAKVVFQNTLNYIRFTFEVQNLARDAMIESQNQEAQSVYYHSAKSNVTSSSTSSVTAVAIPSPQKDERKTTQDVSSSSKEKTLAVLAATWVWDQVKRRAQEQQQAQQQESSPSQRMRMSLVKQPSVDDVD